MIQTVYAVELLIFPPLHIKKMKIILLYYEFWRKKQKSNDFNEKFDRIKLTKRVA